MFTRGISASISVAILGLTLTASVGIVPPAKATEALFDAQSSRLQSEEALLAIRAEEARKDPVVARSRPVEVRRDILEKIKDQAGARCELNLFDDVSFTAEIDHVEVRSPTSISFSGFLIDANMGRFDFAIENDAVLADIWAGGRGSYHLRPFGGGLHVVRELIEANSSNCGAGLEYGSPFHELEMSQRGVASDPNMVDVLVVYTPTARDQAGGVDNINALIYVAVGMTHGAYYNSDITAYLRVVRKCLIDFNESGFTAAQILDRLRDPTDNTMDEIHGWRDEVGADLVILLYGTTALDAGPPDNIHGHGYITSTAQTAFSVVLHTRATNPTWTFAHEIGHNFGANHDHDQGDRGGAFTYAFGHLFTGNDGRQYRTIMARGIQPGERIQYFSNPNVNYEGQPTGVPAGQVGEADNRLCHNNRAATLSGFRDAVAWVNFLNCDPMSQMGLFDSPFCSIDMAIDGSFENSIIRIRAGTSNETPTISMPCRLEAVDGIVIIGQY